MKAIINLLKVSELEYDLMYFDAYWRWCQSVTTNEQDLQMVLANASVNKYYNTEFAKCEAEFFSVMKDYPNANNADVKKMYAECTYSMFNKRSPVLIKQAITNNLNYAN